MTGSVAYAQTLLTPRVLTLGGNGAAVQDLRGFDINPAGMPGLREWDVVISAFGEPRRSGGGAVFQSIALGHGFGEDHAVAFCYSPGASVEFLFPSGTYLGGGALIAGDQSVLYAERFTVGYGFRVRSDISIGAGLRVRSEKVTDTKYELVDEDTTSVIRTREVENTGARLLGDLSLLWSPAGNLRLSAVGRALLAPEVSALPADLSGFSLPSGRALEVGAEWQASGRVSVLAGLSSNGTGSAGIAVRPGGGFEVRAAGYGDRDEERVLTAIALGAGWASGFLTVDAGYLLFLRQDARQGTVAPDAFDPGSIRSIDLHPYTADRFGLSLRAVLGTREPLARIENVKLLGGIYPSAAADLAHNPVGTAQVTNTSAKPVYIRVRFYVDRFMDGPTESQPVHLIPGETAEVPIMAVFNDRLRGVPTTIVRDAEVTVSATPAEDYDDRRQMPVVIHGRNDWNGDVLALRYFVTPSDPAVIRYARDILLARADSFDGVSSGLLPFHKARLILSAFADKMLYISDPRQSADYVQYPSETLDIRGGDCDDMTVCFSSLLNSIGIPTAFVDVVPPERPDLAHIYLLFDTGLEPRFAESITTNPKRYVVRRSPAGTETVWIPVESTAIRRGFEEAWSAGAQRYLDDVEIGLGAVRGWVKIVDVY